METMSNTGTAARQPRVHAPERTSANKPRRNGLWAIVGVAGLVVGATFGVVGYNKGAHSRDKDVAAAEAVGEQQTNTALALGRAGFTNVVNLQMPERGTALATLSADATNPNACTVTFNVVQGPGGELQLTLHQRDASGHEYGTATATTGAAARSAVADLCS